MCSLVMNINPKVHSFSTACRHFGFHTPRIAINIIYISLSSTLSVSPLLFVTGISSLKFKSILPKSPLVFVTVLLGVVSLLSGVSVTLSVGSVSVSVVARALHASLVQSMPESHSRVLFRSTSDLERIVHIVIGICKISLEEPSMILPGWGSEFL